MWRKEGQNETGFRTRAGAARGPLFAARPLTLEEAQQLAAKNNRNLQLARLKVQEAMHKRAGARADYFPRPRPAPRTSTSAGSWHDGDGGRTRSGLLPPPFPSIPVPINLVKQDLFLGGITVGQPLTQLFKIQQEVRAATSEQEIAAARSAGSEDEVRYAVEQLYYALLVSQRQRQAAESKLAAASSFSPMPRMRSIPATLSRSLPSGAAPACSKPGRTSWPRAIWKPITAKR